MTPEQQDHIHKIIAKFSILALPKYEKGALEHGGELWQLDPRKLVREIRNEAIDQFVYVHDIVNWVDKLVARIDELETENKKLKDGK